MLFDLQGKRRRAVQATYLTLAVLMGGGLVLFGIGSDAQGGLFDFFTGGDATDQSANQVVEDQLADAEARLQEDPDDPAALAAVARTNIQLATNTDDVARSQGELFAPEATPRLEAAADAWERYVEVERKNPDDALAFLMTQVYGPQGLDDPAQAVAAAQVVAEERRTPEAYLTVAQYASFGGDERELELAGRRALALAPKSEKKQVQQQLDALEAATAAATKPSGGGAGGAGAPEP